MKREMEIDKLIRKLDMDIQPQVDKRIIENACQHLPTVATPVIGIRLKLWEMLRQRMAQKLMLAAILLLVAIISVLYLDGGSSRVWAQVLANVRDTKSFTCRTRSTYSGPILESGQLTYATTEHKTWTTFLTDVGEFGEVYRDEELVGQYYYSFQDVMTIRINPIHKTYIQNRSYETKEDIAEYYEMINPVTVMEAVYSSVHKELTDKYTYGNVLLGLETNDPSIKYSHTHQRPLDHYVLRVWVDEKTRMPICLEEEKIWKQNNVLCSCKTITDNFHWGSQTSPNLFDPKTLKNYTDVTPVSGDQVHTALRLFYEWTDGKYPSGLDEATVLAEFSSFKTSEDAEGINWLKGRSIAYKLDVLGDIYRFYNKLLNEGIAFKYFGNDPRIGSFRAVLMYWQKPGGEYGVIFEDLMYGAESFPAPQLAKCLFLTRGVSALKTFPGAQAWQEQLQAAGQSPVSILIDDEETQQPQEMVKVYIKSVSQPKQAINRRRTDKFGRCNVVLPYGEYIVAALGWNRGERREHQNTITVLDQPYGEAIVFSIPEVPLLRGRLVYTSGKPASGGRLRIGSQHSSTDDEGNFVLPVPYGDPLTYHMGMASGAGSTRKTFCWSYEDSLHELSLTLDWPARILGRIVDQAGVPQPHAQLSLTTYRSENPQQTWPLRKKVSIDAQGCFELTRVPVGLPVRLIVDRVQIPQDNKQLNTDKSTQENIAPLRTESPLVIELGELTPDQTYDLGDIVFK